MQITISYRRHLAIMSKKDKNNGQLSKTNILEGIIISLLSGAIIAFFTAVFTVNCVYPEKFDRLKTTDKELKESIEKITTRLDDFDTRLRNVQSNLSAALGTPVVNNQKEYKIYYLTNEAYQSMTDITTIEEINTKAGMNCKKDDIVAEDKESGEKFSAESLIDKGVLLPYQENRQEVYFLGQFNKNYHWDGNCTINVYKDNRLILITEAIYDDGNLISYNQVSEDTKKSIEVWNVSNRKRKGNQNTGSTSSYYKTKDLKKNFTTENVKAADIIDVNTFKKDYCTKQEGYYNGNTSGGRYNDNSGKAYLIKYNKKGTIELFYSGKFVDGQPEDDTTQAWSIVPDEEIPCYVWQQGCFTNGHINHEKHIDKKYPLTKKDINKYIKSLNVDKKYLKWNVSYFK